MDHRERSHYPDGIKEDHNRQILIVETEEGEKEYQAEYQVCPDCEGKGKYVNPAIDSQGLSSEDFAEDPDFQNNYFGGMYDIICGSCKARRVILVPTSDEGKAVIAEIIQEERCYQMEVTAERRF